MPSPTTAAKPAEKPALADGNDKPLGAARLIQAEGAPAFAGGEKARRVRSMFGDIAPAYDFNNHLLSCGIDILWRRKTVRMALGGLEGSASRVLDVCSGTGDLALAFRKRVGPGAEVVGCDFALPMLAIAADKEAAPAGEVAAFAGADATRLPFGSGLFDAASVAFGLRNVADQPAALAGAWPCWSSPSRRTACSEASITSISSRFCRVWGGCSRAARTPTPTSRTAWSSSTPARPSPTRCAPPAW
jgi:hypothetical protein